MTSLFVGEFANTKTAGERLGASERTIRRWVKDGQLEFVDGALREIDLLIVDKRMRALRKRPDPWQILMQERGARTATPSRPAAPADGFPVHPELRERIGELPRMDFDDERAPLLRDRPAEFDALQTMLMRVTVPCKDDDRFTADSATLPDSARTMAALCAECPALAACDAYATAALPAAGFWAGQWYPQSKQEVR